MTLFFAGNYAMPTTAAPTAITTGTSAKTMLQFVPPSTRPFKVVKWSVSLASAPTQPVYCELIETGSVAATVTAHVAAGVMPYDRTNGTPVSTAQLGTALTGYTSSSEGTTTAVRIGDIQVIPAGVSQLTWEWSLGREWELAPGKIGRIRLTTSAAVSALTYALWDE